MRKSLLRRRFSQRLRPKVIVLDDDMISLEAALYVSGRALTLEELADIIGKSQSTAQKILDNLSFEYNKREDVSDHTFEQRHEHFESCFFFRRTGTDQAMAIKIQRCLQHFL